MAEQNMNYFTLLGLNPEDPWDEALFEKVLNAKKRQWTRDSMDVIPEAPAARQNLDLVDDIKHVMRNDRLRAEHARGNSRMPGEQRSLDYDSDPTLTTFPQRPLYQESPPTSLVTDLKEPTPAAQIPSPPRETIQHLKVRNMGSALRLSWLWPTSCYEVFVSYSEQHWPTPLQEAGKTIRVTRAFYEERGGYFDLFVENNRRYYIDVSPFTRHAEKTLIAPGAHIEGYLVPPANISYEIRNPRLGFKYRTLHLFIHPPASIPTLLLVTKRNALPLHKVDGELLHREEGPLAISLQETVINLRNDSFPSNTYARLFLEDDSLYSFVIILLPHEKKLRLG